MKKLMMISTLTILCASFSYSNGLSNFSEEIQTVIQTLRPDQAAGMESPDKITAETVLTFGVSTPIAGVSLSPKLNLQWTKSKAMTKSEE